MNKFFSLLFIASSTFVAAETVNLTLSMTINNEVTVTSSLVEVGATTTVATMGTVTVAVTPTTNNNLINLAFDVTEAEGASTRTLCQPVITVTPGAETTITLGHSTDDNGTTINELSITATVQ